ncbi:MAG: hypothetical protein CMJ31_06485 [Phycisphaerae bacterium]|nr:hypothetical protein [Phycisphaerae bacterium]
MQVAAIGALTLCGGVVAAQVVDETVPDADETEVQSETQAASIQDGVINSANSEAPAVERGGPPVPTATDGLPYPVSDLVLEYVSPHPQLATFAPLDDLMQAEVTLLRTTDGFIGMRPWDRDRTEFAKDAYVTTTLEDLTANGSVVLYASALQSVIEAIVADLRERNLLGTYVTTDREQIGLDLSDLRDGDERLRLMISVATVSRVRTIAVNEDDPEQRLDAAEHARIRFRSPVQPWDGASGADPAERRDLIVQDELEDYALRLNRFPGRRVNVAIARGEADGPGESPESRPELQYLVSEADPLRLYFEASNTGVETVDVWRYRLGIDYSQLFKLDDRLSIQYVTAGFDDSTSLLGSYESSFFGNERLRWRIAGGWSDFKAAEVGVADENFEGETWFWSAELEYNIAQFDRLFIDVFGGVEYRDITVENVGLPDGKGQEAVFLPRAGLRFERISEAVQWTAEAFFQWSENNVTGASFEDLQRLGRLNPDREWVTFQWRSELSFYLEPLLFRGERWVGGGYDDPSTWRTSTRAHEIYLKLEGQYAFNRRLIPNFERVVGGLYTVRGYPESQSAGDSVVNGTVEYRFHLPRSFAPASTLGRQQDGFRWRPETVYGLPDWDLMFRGFFDWAHASNSRALAIENDSTLASTGLGVEFRLGSNFVFRTDWGIALNEVAADTPDVVTVGSQRWHFVFTLLF